MRHVLWVLLLVGCGSGNTIMNPDDGGGGGNDQSMMSMPDFSTPPDLAGAFVCGTMGVCGSGNICCVFATTGGQASGACVPNGSCMGDMGVPVECRAPANCGGNPCCVTIANGVPSNVSCTTSMTACQIMYTFGGSTGIMSGTTRLCTAGADCTAGEPTTQYPDCCSAMMGGVTQQFCFAKNLAALSGGKVTCP
jgi:hypothetical protein